MTTGAEHLGLLITAAGQRLFDGCIVNPFLPEGLANPQGAVSAFGQMPGDDRGGFGIVQIPQFPTSRQGTLNGGTVKPLLPKFDRQLLAGVVPPGQDPKGAVQGAGARLVAARCRLVGDDLFSWNQQTAADRNSGNHVKG